MELEPLKNKLIEEQVEGAKFTVGKIIFNEPMAKKSDIKSAVGYLKLKLRDVGIYQGQEWQRIADLIYEAFEDVFKK